METQIPYPVNTTPLDSSVTHDYQLVVSVRVVTEISVQWSLGELQNAHHSDRVIGRVIYQLATEKIQTQSHGD